MLRCLILIIIASLSLAAEPTVSAERHYSKAQWQAINARFTARPRPEYPISARRARITGDAMFRMYIDAQGHVTSVKTLRSTCHQELDAAAIRALMRWRAKPGPKWDLDMPISFTMHR